jgi:predicted nucleic acid-binding protein
MRRDFTEDRAVTAATARRHDATLVTSDTDFEGLPETVIVR